MAEVQREGTKKKRRKKKRSTMKSQSSSSLPIYRQVKELPVAAILYGPPGAGKTSMCAHADGALFSIHRNETGIDDLKQYGQVPDDVPVLEPWDTWESLLEQLDMVAREAADEGFKWLFLDHATWAQQVCFTYVCDEEFSGNWNKKGFFSFQQGPNTAAQNHVPDLINRLNAINESGLNVVLLAHSQVGNVPNPDGEDFTQYQPKLHKQVLPVLEAWAKIIGFINFDIEIDSSSTRAKATDAGSRTMYVEGAGAYVSKNRHGLKSYINMGDSPKEAWENFSTALKEARS